MFIAAAKELLLRVVTVCMLFAIAFAPVRSQALSPGSHADTNRSASTHETIASVVKLINQGYFNQDAIPSITASLLDAEREGRFDHMSTQELAKKLTETLYQASHDKHLYVSLTQEATNTASSLSRSERSRMANFGFAAVEILSGNVGYLKVNSFYRASEGEETERAAMEFLSHADAFILDLRDNGGGSPDTAIQLLSYFFEDANLPLLTIVPRERESTVYTTNVRGVSFRRADPPLYVLVSHSTWSAGEAVPFILQERHRAVIVGEATAGAANPASPTAISPQLSLNIPFGSIESGVRRSNWEGRGIQPDISCPREEALPKAHLEALQALAAKALEAAKHKILVEAINAEANQQARNLH